MQSAAQPFTLPPQSLEVVLALAVVFTAATAASMAAARVTRRLLAGIHGDRFHAEPFVKATLKVVRRMVFALVAMVLTFPALDLAGIQVAMGLHGEDLVRWASNAGLRIALIAMFAYAASRMATSVLNRAEMEIARSGTGPEAHERVKRAQTLGGTIRRFLSATIWTTAVLMMLRELAVDITPILTGAGILGLAVGFGAQTLIKDIISGVFIIAEDQVRVGDYAVINSMEGYVEEINLRTIVLRDIQGTVYTIANGDIRSLANQSKDFSYYVVDLGVAYDEDSDAIFAVIREAGDSMMKDPQYAPSILEPVEVLGVDSFMPSQATLKFRIKTLPLKQWEIGRELRRRVKKLLRARGIRMPSPKMEIVMRRGSSSETEEEGRTKKEERKGYLPDTEQ
jgi:small-conductance mechanosensitive channel